MTNEMTMQSETLIDFQKSTSRMDTASSILKEFNNSETNSVAFFSALYKAKTKLNDCLLESLQQNYQKRHLRILMSKLIEVYLFQRFILKTQEYNGFIEISQIPSELIDDLKQKYSREKFENGIHHAPLKISKGSNLDIWIRSTYLSLASKIFKGIFSYSAHIRYAYNEPGIKQEWEERYFSKHANFHWDQDLNSLTMVIYLSDVKVSDGAFKIIKDSKHYNQNLYLSFYDRFVSDIVGLNAHISSDRVGSFIEHNPEEKVDYLAGPAGTVIQFYGRHIVHDGGYPDVGRSRMAVFVDQRNYLMKPLRSVARLLAYVI